MKLTTNDKNNLMSLYEEAINQSNNPVFKKAEEKIKFAIRNIQLQDVFFASLLDSMIPNDMSDMVDTTARTMYTDGKGLYYNPMFVDSLPLDAVEVVIVHELLHKAHAHHIAFADIAKNHRNLWDLANIATDLSINYLLKDRSGFFNDMLLPGRGEFADLPLNKDAREYFNILLKKYQKPPETEEKDQNNGNGDDSDQDDSSDQQSAQGSGGSTSKGKGGKGQAGGPKEPSDDDSDADGNGEEIGDNDEQTAENGSGSSKSGNKPDKTDKTDDSDTEDNKQPSSTPKSGLDKGKQTNTSKTQEEIYADLDKQLNIPEETKNASDKLGRVEKPDSINANNQQNEEAKHEKEMMNDVVHAEKIEQQREEAGISSAGYGKGSSKFTNKNYRDAFKQKSNLPWTQILTDFLSERSQNERSYRYRNRRFSDYMKDSDILMPGYGGNETKELTFLVDISGSMGRTYEKVFSEISAVSKNPLFNQSSYIRLITFDDGIISEDIFTGMPQRFVSVKTPNTNVTKEHIYKLPLNDKVIDSFRWGGGGGGTNIGESLLDIENKLKPLPKLVIILTDGWFTESDKQLINTHRFIYKIIWLMTTDVKFNVGITYDLRNYDYKLTGS